MNRNETFIPTLRETLADAEILFRKPLLRVGVSWLLPLLLLLAVPAAVQAQFGYMTNADGSIYTYSTNADGSATIAAYSGPPWAVTVPDTINGLPVTSIGIWAFGDTSLTSVTIGNSVTNIGIEAFYFCVGLTNAVIGNGVTNIGSAAFNSCYNLKNITIGNSLTSIETEAFQGCTGLTNVTIGNDLTSIGDSAFYNCTSLINVTIGNGVTNTGVTSIGNEAFTYCTSLKNITIGNSVVSIGIWAFGNCTSLTGVTIPACVTNIGIEAFSGCSSLWTIAVNTNNPAYSSLAGVLFDKSQTTLIQYPGGRGNIGYQSYTIPNGVTSIGAYAFFNCNLTNVTIPNSVTNIGNYAFSRCFVLPFIFPVGYGTSITIPNSVTSIGIQAFSFCTSLNNITIGDGVTSIGNAAFFDCSLGSITIPNSVTNIGIEAFESCGLTSVFFEGNAPTSVGTNVFYGDPATVYHLPRTTGWSATFGGCVTALWNPQAPTSDPSFGVRTNQFGFTITGTSGLVIVVEACTDLVNPIWSPVATNTLTSGSSYFSDPDWTNYPGRFYRFRSP